MLGGSEGGKMWSRQKPQIEELVKEGYCILSLAYFGLPGTPPELRAVPVEQFAKAVTWLRARPEAIPGECAIIGVSRGAELALLLSTLYPEVRAVVAIGPSSVLFPGPPTGIGDALRGQHSGWSRNGRETPFVALPYSWTTFRGLVTGKRTSMFDVALNDATAVSRAAIKVEEARGPMLLMSFARDQVWPSTRMAKQLVTRLVENGFSQPYEHVVCDGGHSEWAVPDCWQRIREFLRARYPPVAVR
jgi:pimeloyl-ACP methyl ester carboxylesterase